MEKLTIGLSTGSLKISTLALIEKLGIKFIVNGRNFVADVVGNGLFSKAIFMRPNDLPLALKAGIVDAIITGYDMLAESNLEYSLIIIKRLNFSKESRVPARVIIFCRQEDSDEIFDSEEINVTSEYPNLARRIFRKAGVVFSSGSTEIKVVKEKFGFRYGIGVTETGRSLKDNGLKIIKTILVSPVVFAVRKKTEEFEIFGDMIEGVLLAENYQLVKFNIASEGVGNVVKVIPSFQSPTISDLANGAVAIETVIAKDELLDATIAIKKTGGRNILIQDINVAV